MTVGHDSSFDHVPRSRSPYPSTLVHEPSLVDWGERDRGSPEEGSSPCGAGYPRSMSRSIPTSTALSVRSSSQSIRSSANERLKRVSPRLF